jgi:hypothetical protein
MASSDSKVATIQTHFQVLSEIASSLNTASDELTKTVSILDEALKKLNVGLTVWVPFRHHVDDPDDPLLFDVDQIGYSKVNGVWGIALRHIWGDESRDIFHEDGPWLFNDAPREMRLYSVDTLTNVVEDLGKKAFDTTKRIQQKTIEVRELAGAIQQITTAEKKKNGHSVAISGLSSELRTAIVAGLRQRHKFVAELLEFASRWELARDSLRIHFPADKRSFKEMLEAREPLSKVTDVAQEVLGRPVQVSVSLEPPTAVASATGKDKGGK